MTSVRRSCELFLLVVLVVASSSVPAAAQGAAQGAGDLQVTVDAAAAPAVSATVIPPARLQGRTLPAGAFEVTEKGDPRAIEVIKLTEDSLEVVLVIDTSGSMRGQPLAEAKAAAAAFLGRVPPATRIAVIGFGPSPVVASEFTTDREQLRAAVNSLVAAGETAIYDAVAAALSLFDPSARKSMVLLSDGADTESRGTLDDTLARVAGSGVRLDAVALGAANVNTSALSGLTNAGRGALAPAQDPTALTGIYDAIASRLLNQYRVGFTTRSSGPTVLRFSVAADGTTASAELTVDLGRADMATATPPDSNLSEQASSARTWMLVAGAAAMFAALLIVFAIALRPTKRARAARTARLGRRSVPEVATATTLSRMASVATEAAERALEQRNVRGRLNRALERAGIALRPGEFAVLMFSAMTVAFLLGIAVSGFILGLLLAGLTALGGRFVLTVMAQRRQQQFGNQLGDVLQLMSGTLRAGYALLQAMDTVAREAERPSAEEFRRVVLESRLGRDLSESLVALSDRVGSEDFSWVVGAIEIHRAIGGDLAEVLDNVAHTIRERSQLRRQVRALSAEGWISAYILGVLPFALMAVLAIVNPGYLTPLTEGGGLVMSAIGAGLLVVGGIWLRRICRLVY